MHCLQLSLAIAEKFSSELQILVLKELLAAQHANIYLPLVDMVLVNKEFVRKYIVELILYSYQKD